MASVFVSGLPKSATREQVSSFLRRTFADCDAVHVLRGATVHEHKGHAYVHFTSTEDAKRAVQVASLQMDGHTLRMRLSQPSSEPVNEEFAAPRHVIEAYEGLPLPPQCIAYSYRRCAYCDIAALDAASAALVHGNQITTTVVLRATDEPSCSTKAGKAQHTEVQVVVFISEAAREEAMMAGRAFARCGPPMLEELLCEPIIDRPLWHRHFARRRLEVASSEDVAAQISHWQAQGLRPLTPSEALGAVAELLEGRGRIAVRDRAGGTAVLRVPTYVASIR